MNKASVAARDCELLGTIGRKRIYFALADQHGCLLREIGKNLHTISIDLPMGFTLFSREIARPLAQANNQL